MPDLGGHRALVTGGAKGIGAGIVRRLVDDGAAVVAADLDEPAIKDLAAATGAEALVVDITDAAAVERSISAHGPFSLLVNNAGVDDFGYFTEVTAARRRRLLDVNLEGTFACTAAVLPAMQRDRRGRIITITSEAGRIGSKGNAVYAATKGALIAFTKSLARENARYGITVNAVAPGPIDTPLLDVTRSLPRGEQMVAAMVAGTQLGRLGTPAEVAAAVAFLASDDASYVTGETLGVSGGMGLGA